jgi:carbon storage regulator
MLVLTRRIGEEIVIAGNIRVTVLAITNRRTRLGIMAPRSVPVTRTELLAETSVGKESGRSGQTARAGRKGVQRASRVS